MKLLKTITAAFDKVIDSLAYLAVGLLVFVWLSVCSEIVMRYFLNRPLEWVVEFSEYGMLFIAFLGAAWLLKEEGHVSIDIVLVWLGPRMQANMNIITSVLGAISCLALAWYSGQSTWDHFQKGILTWKGVQHFPVGFILAPIPIGSFLLFIQFVRRTHGYIRRQRGTQNQPSNAVADLV